MNKFIMAVGWLTTGLLTFVFACVVIMWAIGMTLTFRFGDNAYQIHYFDFGEVTSEGIEYEPGDFDEQA